MLGDDDGVVVIPRAMIHDVVEEALVFEDREDFIRMMLAKGYKLEGLYPTGPEMEERFQKWRTGKRKK
jgi:regulator of RNase E activity RraA